MAETADVMSAFRLLINASDNKANSSIKLISVMYLKNVQERIKLYSKNVLVVHLFLVLLHNIVDRSVFRIAFTLSILVEITRELNQSS